MNLSEHFTLAEMTVTNKPITNVPGEKEIAALTALCQHVLEPIRAHFGKPVRVTSGFRCPELNKAVGGAASSQHVLGEAADISVPGIANSELWHFIVNDLKVFDQCIAERLVETNGAAGWIHVSYNSKKNRLDDRSFIGNGKYPKGFHYA